MLTLDFFSKIECKIKIKIKMGPSFRWDDGKIKIKMGPSVRWDDEITV